MKQEHKHIVIIKMVVWTFKEGLLNGPAIEFVKDGLCSCRYKMGVKTGKATVTMTDGASIEFSYNQGIRQGKAVKPYISFFYKKLQAMPFIFLRSKVQRESLLP